MKKALKPAALTLALAASSLMSGTALAELSANIGVTSNYMWRGETQSDDLPAVSGGLDFEHASGVYVGTWASSLAGGEYELDLYGGFAGAFGDFGYDVGVAGYFFPISGEEDFEVYGEISYSLFSAGLAFNLDSNDFYTHAGVGFELGGGFGLVGTVGYWLFDDDDADDFAHVVLGVTKGEFLFAGHWADLDGDAGEPRVEVTWFKEF